MKALFNTYPMAFHTPGGGEVQLMQYHRHLLERHVDVTLLDMWNPQFKGHDLVHFFSCMSGSLHFCSFIKRIGMPLVVSPNLWITEETRGNYPYDEIRLMFVLADRVICNSNAECDVLATVFNIEREKFATVYNGIDSQFLVRVSPDIFRSKFGITGPFVLNVANVEPRKNQLNLVRALRQHPGLPLVLVGHVRDADYAKQCFAEGGDQLKYLGPLPHDSDELRSAYAACSVFALPSTLETPGLAALEAFACGASVVVTEEGCTREYFGEGALYVDHHDVDGISAAIARGLSRKQARPFLPTIVAGANYTWDTCVDELIRVYHDVQGGTGEAGAEGGFRTIERDGDSSFAWTRARAQFECEAGILEGLWRSETGATADIFLDDEVLYRQVDIPEGWVPFQIIVPKKAGVELRRVLIANIQRLDGGSVNERGVALRDVSFEDSTSVHFERVTRLSGFLGDRMNRLHDGFKRIERTGDTVFVWSGETAELQFSAGIVEGLWRSEKGATADISVDDEVICRQVDIPEGWMPFQIVVPKAAGAEPRRVTIANIRRLDGERVKHHGVALRDVSFEDSGNAHFDGMTRMNALLGGRINRLHDGFLRIERENGSLFVWGHETTELLCQAGIVEGLWRSEAGATADIRVDGELARQQVSIPAEWAQFQIVVPKAEGVQPRHVVIENIHRQDGLASDEYGVALRDVTLVDAGPHFSEAEVLSGLLRAGSGSYSIESDPYRYFVWTGTQCRLRMRPGQLSFVWHSVCGAIVDIDLNGKPWLTGISVGPNWTDFALNVMPDSSHEEVDIALRVSLPAEAAPIGGRLLGVAIGSCRFSAHEAGAGNKERREDAHSN